ncbi:MULTISPECIES: NAD(P)-dependent oxidoreductase [unclassified Achromobacter]|uniref:NAD-dependent epimerase/dehydratase family protein n=1 Tax=unclassified Achromobacter TaxID=2626865 RepID=UPI000B51BBA2|nr:MULTISPECIES: NAD(P)-dependent oxidoreductase [unclassified Achromobacter]OWT76953.1 hypothetical protein CEY04_13160 [Achromobacter sp. HZ28]OWT77833.1 hypothetical protein CEY05_07655 [Achromobacter sp. HZ34]
MMRVLVTGGAGFVGLALAQALLEQGAEVHLFDSRPPPMLFLETMRPHAARLTVQQGSVGDEDSVGVACQGVSHVFHGAAVTAGPRREASEPLNVFDVNVGGTIRVLRAAADAGVKRFVYPSSLTVYGAEIEGDGLLEEATTPAVPDTLYGITKYAAECTALRLGALWGLSVATARIGSVFGPWEGKSGARDLVSPCAQVAALAAQGKPVILPGTYPRREMIYAPDLAQGLIALLATQDLPHERYNLSANLDWSDTLVHWCTALEQRLPGFRWEVSGSQANIAQSNVGQSNVGQLNAAQPNIDYYGATPRAGLDATRACTDLGFTPRFGRDAALRHYADWVARHSSFFS